jgi:hypothetical protein
MAILSAFLFLPLFFGGAYGKELVCMFVTLFEQFLPSQLALLSPR